MSASPTDSNPSRFAGHHLFSLFTFRSSLVSGRRAACPAGRRRPLRYAVCSHSTPNSVFRTPNCQGRRPLRHNGTFLYHSELRTAQRHQSPPSASRPPPFAKGRLCCVRPMRISFTIRSIPNSELRIPNCQGRRPLPCPAQKKGSDFRQSPFLLCKGNYAFLALAWAARVLMDITARITARTTRAMDQMTWK